MHHALGLSFPTSVSAAAGVKSFSGSGFYQVVARCLLLLLLLLVAPLCYLLAVFFPSLDIRSFNYNFPMQLSRSSGRQNERARLGGKLN